MPGEIPMLLSPNLTVPEQWFGLPIMGEMALMQVCHWLVILRIMFMWLGTQDHPQLHLQLCPWQGHIIGVRLPEMSIFLS